MNFYDSVMTILREAADRHGVAGLAQLIDVDRRVIANWLNGKAKGPSLDRIARVCDLMGYTPTAMTVSVEERISFDMPYHPEGLMLDPADYVPVPLVKDENLIDGPTIPLSNIAYFGPVHKSAAFVQGRTHLISVRITDDTLAPLLGTNDSVIVDMDDLEIEQGRLYLVRTPDRSQTSVRRVIIDGDAITFYDKAHTVDPRIFSLSRDYADDLSKAIIGRIIWGRTDMRNL
jgi:transcriptional regulator with XRE-family HTH domain